MSGPLDDSAPLTYIYDPRPAEDTGPWAWLRDLAPGTRLPLYNQAGEHVADAVLGECIPADDEELRFEVAPPRE